MTLIKNGRILDPKTNTDKIMDLVIEGETITQLGKLDSSAEYSKVIDAKGMIVAPGLVDVHVHFREPGFEYKEDILSGSKSAAKGGFTTVVCMANTKPVVDNLETLLLVLEKAKSAKINVLTCAAITTGFDGESLTDMELLHKNGAVGFTDDGVAIMNEETVKKAMLLAKELNVPLSFHEENPEMIGVAGINEGKVAKKLGLRGATENSELVMVERDIRLAMETVTQKINIQHISSASALEAVRKAQAQGANIYAEVTPQHFSATEELILKKGTLAKVNPPLRTEEDRLALIEGLKDNTIQIIATDHAPHSAEEKQKEFAQAPSGMIGLETALALAITHLVKPGHLELAEVLRKLTLNPSRLYGLACGSIAIGGKADMVIFDENESWTVSEDFVSKSSNSPFIGDKLFGKVKYTLCNGKLVYQD